MNPHRQHRKYCTLYFPSKRALAKGTERWAQILQFTDIISLMTLAWEESHQSLVGFQILTAENIRQQQ
jgi:hypothetical protein